LGIDVSHRREKDRDDVCEAEVEKHDLEERPVLLVVVCLDEGDLQPLYFLNALGQLGYDEEPDELHDLKRSLLICDENQNVQRIDN
jgi:hypothetical protein